MGKMRRDMQQVPKGKKMPDMVIHIREANGKQSNNNNDNTLIMILYVNEI